MGFVLKSKRLAYQTSENHKKIQLLFNKYITLDVMIKNKVF